MQVVEELCTAISNRWPSCLIQFEDFQTDAAFAILERMRDRVLCFNDDIQGTGAVVLSGFINGMKAQGTNMKVGEDHTRAIRCRADGTSVRFSQDVRVVFYGAGSSAAGVAGMIASLIKDYGVSEEDAFKVLRWAVFAAAGW